MAFAPVMTVRLDVGNFSRAATLRADLPNAFVCNIGPNVAFFRFGTGPQQASADVDMPMLPGRAMLLTKGTGADYVAAVTSREGEWATLYVTVGSGE